MSSEQVNNLVSVSTAAIDERCGTFTATNGLQKYEYRYANALHISLMIPKEYDLERGHFAIKTK